MSSLKILAPFDGWCCAMDEVPDPVFAARMLGDGLAIDPTVGILCAPCAGEIITLPASAHAVSIRAAPGIDILIHVGIDTVALGGRGFDARVKPGARVRAGEELIRFDLDTVARGSKSLMTPILVTTMDGLALEKRRAAGSIKAGELLFEVSVVAAPSAAPAASASAPSAPAALAPAAAAPPASTDRVALRHSLIMPLRQGLHARPAALIAARAKCFAAEATLSSHGRFASARSIVGIMALGVRYGDELSFDVQGSDAEASLAGLIAALKEAARSESAAGHRSAAVPQDSKAGPGKLAGTAAVPGFAVGRAARIERREIEVGETGAGSAHESAELERALATVRARLERLGNESDATRRAIVAAHLEFLDDPQMRKLAADAILAGKSAGFAWRTAIRVASASLQALDDPRLRERVDDLLDVESHVLLALSGEARPMNLLLSAGAVLIADDLLPSELTALDRQQLAAICLGRGGATSHVAILAAAMEIPMLVGLGPGIHGIAEGSTVIVDADGGTLRIAPSPGDADEARALVASRRARRAAMQAEAQAECRALDGTRIEVFANLGSVSDVATALGNGAEGCGLLRTEFLFIDRDTPPAEDEQLAAYQAIADALGPRLFVLRLMDVGGDKPLRYLPLPAEDNPALGLRGVRTSLAHPGLLRTQLRAALRVQPAGRVRLLIPMVTDTAEIRALRGIIDELMREAAIDHRLELGAMIETPAAALMAGALIREVDFMSIGSNDLTQYALAMDRGHPQLAGRVDALHPAVLKLIASAAGAGVAAGKPVAVCGGVAADRLAVPILLGLGVNELSVVPSAIPAIKRQIRSLRIAACRDLALRCLDAATAADVRSLATDFVQPLGEMP